MIPITCNAVGDILALATLFLDIAHALDDSRGSPAKYCAFNGELKSLHIVLASVARVAELTTDPMLRDEIVREVDCCGKDVRRALERVAKFSVLGRDESANNALHVQMKRQWYKLEWRFGWHGSVETIREDLASATQRLTVYLVTSNADGIQNLGVSITSQFDAMTSRICTMAMEQFAAVGVRDAALSRTVHNNTTVLGQLASQRSSPTLPGTGLDSSKAAAAALLCYAICTMHDSSRSTHTALLLAAFGILMFGLARDGRTIVSDVKYTQYNSIILDDAMGRRLVLPLELCETPELFHATLVNLFSRTNGCWFVNAHRYELTFNGKFRCIDNWDIRPDTEVEMSIIVQSVRDGYAGIIQCPVCLVEVKQGFTDSYGTWQCFRCGRELQGYSGPRRHETFLDDAQGARKSMLYDRGRFPRARETTISSTRSKVHTALRNQHVDSSGSRESLSDMSDSPELLLDWKHQVLGFTRFIIPVSVIWPILPFPPLSESEDCLKLHLAAKNGHYALVAEILDQDADIEASVTLGYTALHLASFAGHTRVVDLLLDHGAAIDAATEDNLTPLACAILFERRETTELLVARGSMADTSESVRAAVLNVAASVGNVGIVQMLLDLGQNIAANNRSETALHVAVRYRQTDVVEVLLRNGAALNARDANGDTPLLIAVLRQDPEIFALLWVSGGLVDDASPSAAEEDIGHFLCRAAHGNSHAIFAIVLQHMYANLNGRFEDGTTPLYLSSERRRLELVELLLSQGGDLDVEALPLEGMMKEGSWKPLHAAAYSGHVNVVEILLRHGVDVNLRTEIGDTPLSLALEGKQKAFEDKWHWAITGYNEVLDVLLSAGAVMGERSSLLQEEIACLNGSSNIRSGLGVPGAWCEEAE